MPAPVLLLDNYDSFVFNLSRYIEELGIATEVVRSDAISIADVESMKPRAIVLSPGPCTPAEAGICVDLVRQLATSIPMLGVCLGHQAIAAAFGANIVRAEKPLHGRFSWINCGHSRLFEGLDTPLRAARYHSLVVEEESLPEELVVTATTDDGIVMAIEHGSLPVFGIQFHPESILTRDGHRMLANFLASAGLETAEIPVGDTTMAIERPSFSEPLTEYPLTY